MDKQRNAAVVIGDRDLKTDVKNKKKRERFVRKKAININMMK